MWITIKLNFLQNEELTIQKSFLKFLYPNLSNPFPYLITRTTISISVHNVKT